MCDGASYLVPAEVSASAEQREPALSRHPAWSGIASQDVPVGTRTDRKDLFPGALEMMMLEAGRAASIDPTGALQLD
jgi:hypothetical protein